MTLKFECSYLELAKRCFFPDQWELNKYLKWVIVIAVTVLYWITAKREKLSRHSRSFRD
jgi:hypothetical protein